MSIENNRKEKRRGELSMQRIALPAGAAIQLNNRDYTIDKVIGDGATCMVYSAHYTDAAGYPHYVNLKECYPYHAEIRRDQQNMLWKSDEEKEQSLSAFRQAYDKLMTWQNNTTVKAFDMCEANNTLYIVMNADQGQPFDKDSSSSLHELLQTTLALTKTVQKYHGNDGNGYLHLDIKPSNFLTIPETRELVILFDLDTVTAISDIRSGNIRCVSYSDGWAAPEQKQGKLDKLCPATDIFAIGAILFEKVMGRQVAPADMSIFADWDFEGELFDDGNPKIKRILRTIFQKTLAANVRRRYQKADDLAEILKTACDVAKEKVFIVAPELQIPAHFIGRDFDINAIHKEFQSNKNAVFLHGVGGIGKSSLAMAYAVSHKRDYDTVLFCRYKTSLEDLLDDLADEIQNFEGDTKAGRKKLKDLLNKDTLLIVDNFDVATDKDPYLHQFLKLKAKLLFTTRTDFSGQLSVTSVQLEVSALSYTHLESLFSRLSHITINTAEKQQCLRDLLQSIDYHTYVTELLARQIVASGWTLETLSRKMQNGLNSLADAEMVQATKDESSPKQTIPEGLRVLFNLAALDEHSKQVLRNMYILDGFVGITKDTYKLFCNSEMYSSESRNDSGALTWFHFSSYVPESAGDVNVLNELCEQGWIQKRYYDLYMLHPLIAELILHDLKPCQENCQKLYKYVDAVLKSYICFSKYDDADEYEHRDHFDLLCTFFNHVDLVDSTNRKMCMDFIQGSIECFDTPAEWLLELEFEDLATKFVKLAQQSKIPQCDAYELYLQLLLMSLHIHHECGTSARREENIQICYGQLSKAANQLPEEERHSAEERIYREISYLFQNDHILPPKAFVEELFKTHPEVFEGNVDKDFYMEWYNLSESTNHISGVATSTNTTPNDTLEDSMDAWEKYINKLSAEYWAAPDKLAYVQNLYKHAGFKIYQVVAFLIELYEWHFAWYAKYHEHNSDKVKTRIQDTNYDGIEATMDYSEYLRESSSWRKEYNGYSLIDDEFFQNGNTGEPCNYLNGSALGWRIQLSVLQANWNRFETLMASDEVSASYTEPRGILWDVARTCWNLGCCHRVLKYLVQWIEEEEKDPGFDERECTSTYDAIVWYAQWACEEVGEDSEQYRQYQQIATEFKDRIATITGKKYTLKRDLQKTPE